MSLVNEEQASQLWCPMVRTARRETTQRDGVQIVVVGGCNTDALGGNRVPASCRCIASKCAMWRWFESEGTFPECRLGYCGMAGPAVHS